MKRILVGVVFILLSFNCSARERVKVEPLLPLVTVEWIAFKTAKEVHNYCVNEMKVEIDSDENLIGCAVYDRENSHCIIVAEIPKFVNDDERMDTLGHEVLHCFGGDFHKD